MIKHMQMPKTTLTERLLLELAQNINEISPKNLPIIDVQLCKFIL